MKHRALLLGLFLVMCGDARAAAPPPSKNMRWSNADIEAVIRRLGSDDFATREEASWLLLRIDGAEPHLRCAVTSTDPEVARRARRILSEYVLRPPVVVPNPLRRYAVGRFYLNVEDLMDDFVGPDPHNPFLYLPWEHKVEALFLYADTGDDKPCRKILAHIREKKEWATRGRKGQEIFVMPAARRSIKDALADPNVDAVTMKGLYQHLESSQRVHADSCRLEAAKEREEQVFEKMMRAAGGTWDRKKTKRVRRETP
jgi:hypothetical protein